MNYYKRHLGDYYKKCGKLTMLQHGAYNMLIDECYSREQFPTRDQAYEWLWAATLEEQEAVDFILSRFFIKTELDIFVQKRIAEELDIHKTRVLVNKQVAIERETNRVKKPTNRSNKRTNRERIVHESPRIVNESSPEQHESLQGKEEEENNQAPMSPKDIALRRAKRLFLKNKDREVSMTLDRSEARSWEITSTLVLSTSEQDWQDLEWLYSQSDDEGEPGHFRRRNLATLLNNWNSEISKAESERARAIRQESEIELAWDPSRIVE